MLRLHLDQEQHPMPNFLFHIDVEGAEDVEHVSKLASGFLDALDNAQLRVTSATVTSHTNFAHPVVRNLRSAPLASIEVVEEKDAPLSDDELLEIHHTPLAEKEVQAKHSHAKKK
jgi:hypothetical protein